MFWPPAGRNNVRASQGDSPMSTGELLLIAMGIIPLVPYFIWRVGRTEYYVPLAVVPIFTGIMPRLGNPQALISKAA